DADVAEEAVVVKQLVVGDDLLRHLLWRAHEQMTLRRAARIELSATHRRPAALAPDAVHHLRVGPEELVGRALGGVSYVHVRVDADRQLRGLHLSSPGRLAIKLYQRREASGGAADDGDHQGQAEHPGAGDRGGRAADCDPYRQRLLQWAWINSGVVQRGTMVPRPGDVLGGAQREQQLQFLGKQLVVVLQLVAIQREGLRERSPSGHDLGTPTGEQVERRELL